MISICLKGTPGRKTLGVGVGGVKVVVENVMCETKSSESVNSEVAFASAAEGVFMHQKVPCSFVLVCA